MIAALPFLRVAEHGRLDADGRVFEEDHAVGLADIDDGLAPGRDHLGRAGQLARHAEHARDVHDAAHGQDAQRHVRAEQLLADQPAVPSPPAATISFAPAATSRATASSRLVLRFGRDDPSVDAGIRKDALELLGPVGARGPRTFWPAFAFQMTGIGLKAWRPLTRR